MNTTRNSHLRKEVHLDILGKRVLTTLLLLIMALGITSESQALSSRVNVRRLETSGLGGVGFGNSVSISGFTIVIGTKLDDDDDDESIFDSGSAYVFGRDRFGNWIQQAKLTAGDFAGGDEFGSSISIDEDTVVIGAPKDDNDNAIDSGSAYVFARDSFGNWSQQAKLTADDFASGDEFGNSVSIDGDIAVIGSYEDDDNNGQSGSAYVFVRDSSGNWSQTAKLKPNDGAQEDRFGISVSISGNSVLIGSYLDDLDGENYGSAYVFVLDDFGNWNQQAKLIANDGNSSDLFGVSVSIDGDSALIGANADDDNAFNSGSAYLFVRNSSGNWSQKRKITVTNGSRSEQFGLSVSIVEGRTRTSTYALIGTNSHDAYGILFSPDNIAPFANNDFPEPIDHFGEIEINVLSNDSDDDGLLDASTVSITEHPSYGNVSINSSTGLITYSHRDRDQLNDSFTYMVADNEGAFSSRAEVSIEINPRIIPPQAQDDTVGPVDIAGEISFNVLANDIDEDGYLERDTVTLVDGPSNGTIAIDTSTGFITYTHDGSETSVDSFTYTVEDNVGAVSEPATVSISINSAPVAQNDIASSVNIAGVIIINVLANDSDFGGTLEMDTVTLVDGPSNGEIEIDRSTGQFTYTHDGSETSVDSFTYTVEDNEGVVSNIATVNINILDINKLFASDGTNGDSFGISASLDGDTALIGAPFDDDNGTGSGAAYVYVRDDSGTWNEQEKLTAVDGVRFGLSVSIVGDTAVIGAILSDGNVSESGSAYVFVRDGFGSWSQQAKLTANDGAENDAFGRAVSIAGDTIVIGANGDGDNGSGSGSAYVFVDDGSGTWNEQSKLTADDGAENDAFGWSISIAGDIAVIGAYQDDDNGSNSGSAYVFFRNDSGNWFQEAKLIADDSAEEDLFSIHKVKTFAFQANRFISNDIIKEWNIVMAVIQFTTLNTILYGSQNIDTKC